MTRDEILALSGSALRAAVAEHVMGWTWSKPYGCDSPALWSPGKIKGICPKCGTGPDWESSPDACLVPDGPVARWLATAPNNHYVITSRWVDCQDTLLRLHWIVGHNGTPAGIAEALCRAVLIATMEAR